MIALVNLQSLVDSYKIRLFELYYPNVSVEADVQLEWIASYEDIVTMKQQFCSPGLTFIEACEELCKIIDNCEYNQSSPESLTFEEDVVKSLRYIESLEGYIQDFVSDGDYSWLLSLTYSSETGINQWTGTIEGGEWTNMQIVRTGERLAPICQELLEFLDSQTR